MPTMRPWDITIDSARMVMEKPKKGKVTNHAIVVDDVAEDVKMRIGRGHGGRVLDGFDEILV